MKTCHAAGHEAKLDGIPKPRKEIATFSDLSAIKLKFEKQKGNQ